MHGIDVLKQRANCVLDVDSSIECEPTSITTQDACAKLLNLSDRDRTVQVRVTHTILSCDLALLQRRLDGVLLSA